MRIYLFAKQNTINKEASVEHILQLKKELEEKLGDKFSTPSIPTLSEHDTKIVKGILRSTKEWNVNNISRTKAYLDYYKRNPEIHWAFLAHMVSRNGGWNMTDLKGEFLSKLLTENEQADFYLFLERGNWLIFQDVFPQLLLYEKSRKMQMPLFHLLPALSISTFMETMWEFFWRTGDRRMLTISLIINEQNYLEQKLLEDPHYNRILKTIVFSLQDLFSLNHILFPYVQGDETKVIGQTLHQFASLHERIELGKRMYKLMFTDKRKNEQLLKWANSNPHTGSRSDYWPHLFKNLKETLPGRLYNPQVKDCSLKPGASHLYSPELQYVWKNITHTRPCQSDWFQDSNVVQYLHEKPETITGEIQHAYCKSLEKLAFTIFTKKAIFLRRG